MKLNVECIRDVLIEIESQHRIEVETDGLISIQRLDIGSIYKQLPQYQREDIYYSVLMLSEAEYVLIDETYAMGGVYSCEILRMTYAGHEFLAKIRDDKQWSNVRKALGAIRNYSISAISAIAEGVTSAAINSQFLTS